MEVILVVPSVEKNSLFPRELYPVCEILHYVILSDGHTTIL